MLGVATTAYAPFALVNLLTPLLTIAYGFTGFSIHTLDEDDARERLTGLDSLSLPRCAARLHPVGFQGKNAFSTPRRVAVNRGKWRISTVFMVFSSIQSRPCWV